MATEMGPMCSTASKRSASDSDLMYWQDFIVAPTLALLKLQVSSCAIHYLNVFKGMGTKLWVL